MGDWLFQDKFGASLIMGSTLEALSQKFPQETLQLLYVIIDKENISSAYIDNFPNDRVIDLFKELLLIKDKIQVFLANISEKKPVLEEDDRYKELQRLCKA